MFQATDKKYKAYKLFDTMAEFLSKYLFNVYNPTPENL